MNTIKIAIAATAFAIGGTVGPLLAPAAAHADVNDDAFLDTLLDYNVPMPGGRSEAIRVGHLECTKLRSGYTPGAVVNDVYYHNASYTMSNAAHFIGAAMASYCPDQGYKIGMPNGGTTSNVRSTH